MNMERQEIHCHHCGKYVQFDMDMSLNGNHVLPCPNCGHEHCRVVKDGIITEERWAQRNGDTIQISSTTITVTSSSVYLNTWNAGTTNNDTTTSTNYASAYTFLASSWMNAGRY